MSEKYLRAKMKELEEGVTPGFVLQVYLRGQKKMDLSWGQTWKYYDLASLTKIIFTVPWVIKAVQEKKVSLHRPVRDYLGGVQGTGSVARLLSHSAGSTWWEPFYKQIDRRFPLEKRKLQLRQQLNGCRILSASKAVYSDIDFFLLGFLLENVLEKDWVSLFLQISEEFYDSKDLFFNLQNKPLKAKKWFAPTEDCPWRKKVLQGEVHDENAWSLGGIAPHAGLFGTVDAVSQWGLKIRKIYRGQKGWLNPQALRPFVRRQSSDWALGFMMPTVGASSAGQYFSQQSFGHTGFTGTSWWYDPKKDLMVTLLSNRVHPHRANNEFKNWRPRIHDWVYESLF